ncbi:MAG: hypothetical protein LBG52_03040 [Candidatus Peribacteria bacterium]|jgi:hypothetical protein|nr:hypothetical protein [Candidatus Peribacteria bacterium]
MKYFYAYGNNFVGNLPEIYGQWSGIIAFAIGNNKFEGTLPISYGAWSHIVDA